MHSVALDKAHEMLVNKDLIAIVGSTKEYLDCMLYYYPVRSTIQKAVEHEVLLNSSQSSDVRVLTPPPPKSA